MFVSMPLQLTLASTAGDILAAFFVAAGLFFMAVGAIGIWRFPDAYHRLHASSKCSTLGLLGLILGAVCHIGTLAVATKAIITMLFAFVAFPVGSHILAKAAHIDGLEQWKGTLSDDLAEDKAQDEASRCERMKVRNDDPLSSDGVEAA